MGLGKFLKKSAENDTTLNEGENKGIETSAKEQKRAKKGLQIAGKGEGGRYTWIFLGIVLTIIVALFFSAFYETFRNRAKAYIIDPTENEANLSWLYETSFLLYRDLYNTVNGTQADYTEIYLEMQEGYSWLLDQEKVSEYIEQLEAADVYYEDETGELTADVSISMPSESSPSEENGEKYDLSWQAAENVLIELQVFDDHFHNLGDSYDSLSRYYDYCLVDHNTGKMVTNMASGDVDNRNDRRFLISFVFDSAGNVSIGEELYATDEDYIRRMANSIVRQNTNPIEENLETITNYGKILTPRNCTITFSISENTWSSMNGSIHVIHQGKGRYSIHQYVDSNLRYAYTEAGVFSFATIFFLFVGLLGLLYAWKSPKRLWKQETFCAPSAELLLGGGLLWYLLGTNGMVRWVSYVAEGQVQTLFADTLNIFPSGAQLLVSGLNLVFVSAFLMGGWYIGICVIAIKDLGPKEYIKQKSFIYRVFPYTKSKLIQAYEKVANLDLTKDAHKTIIWLLVVNGVILLAICSLWVAGWAVVVVYSLILYVVLSKYISDLQKRYGILLKSTNEIAKGNLNVTIDENLGVFEPFKPEIIKIQEGFRNAVDEEVKSQRMKAELITNVSHDLKTPLTAIITYVNLLKEENVTEEQRKEYLDTLERKSMRLKVLIEDLFEVSKANSQNMTLNIMDVDIMNLVKQVSFEMSDKISASGLDIRMNLPEGRVVLPLDSQKTYRVYENLFGNVAKYAMPGTRVYVGGALKDGCVEITLKNITAQEITVDSSELTERFVRNDSSRNTEGSGLGLAIAKSFMEIQGGNLKLEVDGDLFKVTTIWPLNVKELS